MPKTMITLYGSTDINQENIDFIRNLVDALLAHPDVVLVSSGFWHWDSDPVIENTSVDLATLTAMENYIAREGISLDECFQTWLPEEAREHVIRFSIGKERQMKGSPRARRFQLVQGVDAIITIAGKEHTATVLELALALGKPILPIGFSGGDSEVFWHEEQAQFMKLFELPQELVDQLSVRPTSELDRQSLAKQIAITVLKQAQRRCLVLMGFQKEHDEFFDSILSPAIENAGFEPHRLDRHEDAGDITGLFLSRLADCHAIIVDITGLNPNVMYELGHIHHDGRVSPVIVTHDDIEHEKLPFYLRQHQVIAVKDNIEMVQKRIERQLLQVKKENQIPVWKSDD